MSDNDINYKDLLILISEVKKSVKDKFNIDLVNEVRIIKN
jgi:UDP-N-acetylenolpyruvoylglucosamine reductase